MSSKMHKLKPARLLSLQVFLSTWRSESEADFVMITYKLSILNSPNGAHKVGLELTIYFKMWVGDSSSLHSRLMGCLVR
jgi:hypothetical protein